MRITRIAVTLALALAITIIQIFRMTGGSYAQMVAENLDVTGWALLYSQPWRILTSPFIHHNMLHYLGNLIFLILFGWQIERKQGWAVMLAVFFGALITGYVIWINLTHNFIIGISGGICGLFGYSLIANRRRPWWTTVTHHPLLALYALNLLSSVIVDQTGWLSFQIAHLNHLAGILYGIAFGGAFLLMPPGVRWGKVIVIALPFLLLASLLYSPWQIEWRLIKNQETIVQDFEECRLKSEVQEKSTKAPIEFVNNSAEGAAVYWLDYDGRANFQVWLKGGESREWNSFVGHYWCVVNTVGEAKPQTFVVTEPDQTITIR